MIDRLLINLSFLFSQPTGIATYASNLVPHLKQLNPTLLTAKKFDNFNCYPIPDNLTPAQGSKGHLRRLLWTQLKLPQIYRKFKSSLLFSPVPEAPINQNCRYIITVHDLIPLRFPRPFSPITIYFRYYLPQVLNQAEHIICNSHATANDLIDFFGIESDKITPIPLAYNKNRDRGLNLAKKAENPPYFLYIGRYDPYKNLHRTIEAFAKCDRECQLWLVGSIDPRYTPQLKGRSQELGIQERVKFLGYVVEEKLSVIISNAIALVFPSLWEGFGLPVLEAMALGTPVITSNLSSLPEVAGDAGILVDPYNTFAIAAAMKNIAQDSQLRSKLSQLSLKQAELFSWEKTGLGTREVLEKFLK